MEGKIILGGGGFSKKGGSRKEKRGQKRKRKKGETTINGRRQRAQGERWPEIFEEMMGGEVTTKREKEMFVQSKRERVAT